MLLDADTVSILSMTTFAYTINIFYFVDYKHKKSPVVAYNVHRITGQWYVLEFEALTALKFKRWYRV